MKSKFILSIFLASLIVIVLQMSFASSQLYETNYSSTVSASSNTVYQDAYLSVLTLKYDPYPVNAGDWFDLWVKVQNIGQNDAPNVRVTLDPQYPFFSNDSLVREFGLIPGSINAFKYGKDLDASQIIMKFRVKVEDNAPIGVSNLNLKAETNKGSGSTVSYELPIEVGKTRTDFDVVMQGSTSQGTSFAISNIGSTDATAVTVSLEPQNNFRITGPSASIVGNLAKGDFTSVTYQISALNSTSAGYGNRAVNSTRAFNMTGRLDSVKIKIDYTDSVGVRNSVEKVVPVSLGSISGSGFGARTTAASSSSSSNYIYLIAGVILGMIILVAYRRFRHKK